MAGAVADEKTEDFRSVDSRMIQQNNESMVMTEPGSPNIEPKTSPPVDATDVPNLTGWRLVVLLASLYVGLFLSFLDTTIVSVALPTIAATFDAFSTSTWVLTAYLLTYMAFATIIARLSDIFGKKTVEVASFVVFVAASLGCGLSRNMTELIVMRALQGVGGSGLFSMTMVIGMRAVPPSKMAMIGAGVGVVMVTAGVLGPILSGAITGDGKSGTWRWIFYLNVPIGVMALLALLVAWPIGSKWGRLSKEAVKSVDFLGCVLLLAASVLLIFALEEGGAYIYAWNSATIIACLVVSGLSFVAFVAWQECLAAHASWPVQVIFPTSVVRQRVVGAAVL